MKLCIAFRLFVNSSNVSMLVSGLFFFEEIKSLTFARDLFSGTCRPAYRYLHDPSQLNQSYLIDPTANRLQRAQAPVSVVITC